MTFSSKILGAASAFAIITGAFGGVASAQAPAARAQATPAKPSSAKPSPAQMAAAREVVVLSGISKTYDLFFPQLADSLVNSMTRTRPELRNDLIATIKALKPEFDKRDAEMVEATAGYFAAAMSEQALKETAAFFKSEAGKQYVLMQPQVIDQMMASLDVWNRRMSEDIVTRVREEMRKKGHTL